MTPTSSICLVEAQPNDFIGVWLSSLSDKTALAYSGDIEQFFEFLGHDDIAAVRRSDCHAYKGFVNERYPKSATANRKLTVMRCLLTEAVRYGIIAASPAEGIRGHKRDQQFSPTKAPSSDQVKAMFAGIGEETLIDLRDRALISVAALMGLRRTELAVLTTKSIFQDAGKTVLEIRGKGNKLRRNVIPKPTLEALMKWLAVAQITDGPLFQPIIGGKPAGRQMDSSTIYYTICRRLEAAGIEGCSPHSLRHYNITQLLARGASIDATQRWSGHADPRTTQGYNHAQQDINDSPAQLMED